ncbi:MAG: FKBP-type peptidyl-prolyl cis-trans isomerase [Ferruginibacter sp.]
MKRTALCMLAFVTVTISVNAQGKKVPVKTTGKTAVIASPLKTAIDSFSYSAGLNIAESMKLQGITNLNASLVQRAIDDVLKKRTPLLTEAQANLCLQQQLSTLAQKKSSGETAKGKAFLEANKKRTGVITLPDGLQYEIIKAGDAAAAKPLAIDTVVVNYKGTLIDGTEFDNSFKRGEPAVFPLNRVISGWTEILQLMTKGAHWKVYIPSGLGYGDSGSGAIPPGATLVFEIILENIKPATVK